MQQLPYRLLSFLMVWVFVFSTDLWGWGAKEVITIGQTQYISLNALAKQLGFKVQRVEPLKKIALVGKIDKAVFEIHKREVFVNGRRIYLGNPVSLCSNQLYISELDAKKTIKPLLVPHLLKSEWPVAPKKIVIDPGHGGSDPGAQNHTYGLSEKSLALDLALRLKKQLMDKGFTVVLTREKDVKIPLKNRPEFANRSKADLFISLHCNAVSAKDVKGIETYALTPVGQPSTGRGQLEDEDLQVMKAHQWDVANMLLAYRVQCSLTDQVKGEDRGVKRARFAVLKYLECPGILIECGFLSHNEEAKRLHQPAYREALASAITNGVMHYVSDLSKK